MKIISKIIFCIIFFYIFAAEKIINQLNTQKCTQL